MSHVANTNVTGTRSRAFSVALIAHGDNAVPPWVEQALSEAGVELRFEMCTNALQVVQLAGDVDVVWTMGSHPAFNAEGWRTLLTEALPQLKRCGAIVRGGSGVDNVPVDLATQSGILVCNTPGATAEPVAEFTVALLLAGARRLPLHQHRAQAGQWQVAPDADDLSVGGKTLGLVGFGHIARLVARRLAGFEMTVLATDPSVDEAVMAAANVRSVTLSTLLAESDFVSVHCPLNGKTRGLIGEAELRAMKSDALLINTARGGVVHEPSLVRALKEGWIRGACLDVLEHEPPASDHPLLGMEQVIVTPHAASFDQQLLERMWRLSVQTIRDLAEGRWPSSCINRGMAIPRWALQDAGK